MAYVIQPAPIPAVAVHGGGQFPVHRIYCVGRNYVEHAQEMGHSGREPPFFFTKPADSIVPVAAGETGRIAYPSQTKNLHHEIELVVALAKGGRDIRASDAAALIGPLHAIASTGELSKGAITLKVNGQLKQKGDLADLIWNVGEIVEHLSSLWTLAPGDLIYTGTPAGVGAVVK